MPPDIQDGYDRDVEAWISEDKEIEIRQKCIIRLRLLGVMCDNKQVVRLSSPLKVTFFFWNHRRPPSAASRMTTLASFPWATRETSLLDLLFSHLVLSSRII